MEATRDTLLPGAYDFDSGVQNLSVQTTFSIRSAIIFPEDFLRAAKHSADSDGRPTAGAQVVARVSVVPWHPYRSGPALHCRVPSRSESCYLSKSDRRLLSFPWSCCLVLMVKPKLIFGPSPEISLTVITQNAESNCTCPGDGSPRHAYNRRRRTREGPEPACVQKPVLGGVTGRGEGRINVLPWHLLLGVTKTSS